MQQEQAKWLEQAVEQMRGQRHDFKKHISMIYYFNEKGKTEEVEKYIRQIQDNIDRIREEHIDTGNYALDSILNAQMSKAQLCGVNLQVECVVPQELNLSTYDMNVMLTNLLDNSIEAAQKTEEKKVQCVIRYDMPRNAHQNRKHIYPGCDRTWNLKEKQRISWLWSKKCKGASGQTGGRHRGE